MKLFFEAAMIGKVFDPAGARAIHPVTANYAHPDSESNSFSPATNSILTRNGPLFRDDYMNLKDKNRITRLAPQREAAFGKNAHVSTGDSNQGYFISQGSK